MGTVKACQIPSLPFIARHGFTGAARERDMVTGLERHRGGGQFSIPHGIGGRVAGLVMRVLNEDMVAKAAELLDAGQDDAILEIGFGPGTLIWRLTERAPQGFVAGIDVSE